MSEFQYAYKDAEFILGELVGFDDLCEAGGLEDINVELASAVLEEAARLAGEVVAPLNEVGDREGATVGDDGVRETPGFAEAYRQYVEGGWAALPFNEEYGGQGMPKVLGTAADTGDAGVALASITAAQLLFGVERAESPAVRARRGAFVEALLERIPNPSNDDIDGAMGGNICRCGTYTRIRDAIHRAAEDKS